MKLDYVGNKIGTDDIDRLEKMVNAPIPTEYQQFLYENNGGMPEDDYVFDFMEIDVENNGATGSDLHYFFNVSEICEWYTNLTYEELIAKQFLPIACDTFDNAILLNLGNEENYGAIYFADHESSRQTAPFWTTVKVADSFSDFINRLKPMFG